MWSEEELRDIPDPPRAVSLRSLAPSLRQDVTARGLTRAQSHPHELSRSSVVYTPTITTHGNFIDASYRRMLINPAWLRRLKKPHTAKRRARLMTTRVEPWCELDAATSSDALLMNLFCYPRILATSRLPALLGIDRGLEPVFGFKPRIPLHRNLVDTTEIDLKLGPLLIEAKLTESGFSSAPLRKLERYRDLHALFDPALLHAEPIPNYQLIRGVLAAHALNSTFCLLCDARRPDLIDAWYTIIRTVRPHDLRARLRLLTWQDLIPALPKPLAAFIDEKYGIAVRH